MFYEESFVSSISARCNENAVWDFNSNKLHCVNGLLIIKKHNIDA